MSEVIQKAFRISDGVASLAHRKLLGLVKDLEKEGALTKKESQKLSSGLSKVKKEVYDAVSRETKRMLSRVEAKAKAVKKKRR
jgi:polyhydroxyalkanoate synthesis regulator phasin